LKVLLFASEGNRDSELCLKELVIVRAGSVDMMANGGVIVQPIGGDAPEITARFRDPAGNIMGLYQEPAAASQG